MQMIVDSWQCGSAAYYAVQGGSNFWGFLNEILKYTHSKESCSLRSRKLWSGLLCCEKSFLVLNLSYKKCDQSSEKYRAELSWCKNFTAVLWCKKKY